MKKNLILGLTMVAVVGCVLTGCGKDKDVTKVDDTQAVVTESTQAALEKDLEPAGSETTTEAVTEAPTEEVKADFLAENGLKITPNGSMTIPLAVMGTDDMVDAPITTAVKTVASSEEGYSDTTFTVDIDVAAAGKSINFNVSAFDRYTGTSFESEPESIGVNNGSTHDEVVVVDIDGTQYDCAFTTDMNLDSNNVQHIVATIHHPSNYDGVVFTFGGMTATQITAYDAVDSSKTFTIADYSDVFIDGQYFFTATDK